MRKFVVIILALSCLSGISCKGNRSANTEHDGELYQPLYALGFSLYRSGQHSSILEVRNPWQGAENISSRLFISRDGEKAPEGFAGQSVAAPLRNVVCLSSTHIAFIDAIGEIGSVRGVSGVRYITNEHIRKGYAAGAVKDVGYDTNMNFEMLAAMRPDLVFIYGVGGENTRVTDKLRELGLAIVYIAEYLEEEPLGKSEWIIPFGELFDKRDIAEEIFEGIAERYNVLKAEADALAERPGVMLNAPYRDVWFTPGDHSYMARLVADAGGRYTFAGSESSVSRPVSVEAAWTVARDADIWLNPNQMTTLEELKAADPRFADVKPVRKGNVFNCTKRQTDGGGSDFWESGTLRADRVLEDLMICLHPGWAGGRETYYFERLK